MKRIPAWLTYSVLRLIFFFVPFAVLYAVGVWWWLAALVAALFSFSLSLLALRSSREKVAEALYEARNPTRPLTTPDEDFEDANVDSVTEGAEDSAR